jgi:hypothetical protein
MLAPMLLAALFSGGCASTGSPVRVDQAEVDLSLCRTFGWLPAASDAESLTEQRVRSEALRQLEEKGYEITSEKPDCRITYVASIQELPRPRPRIGVGASGGSRGVHGGLGVHLPIGRRDAYSGTFTLDVIDAARKAQIWSGSLDASFEGPELTEDEARRAVEIILAEFPDRNEAR